MSSASGTRNTVDLLVIALELAVVYCFCDVLACILILYVLIKDTLLLNNIKQDNNVTTLKRCILINALRSETLCCMM